MTALIEQFKAVVCDLDGVVYAGPTAIDHAVVSLNAVVEAGRPVVFATNNASRPPQAVSEHLNELGLHATLADVLNSSMAGAYVLAKQLPSQAKVLAVGGIGVSDALTEAGLTAVSAEPGAASSVEAVLQGYGPNVTASQLAEAAYAVQKGAVWVATNTDRTLPTDRGVAPGNGTLVSAVETAVGTEPLVVGKPTSTMYDIAVERLALEPQDVVGIGDRLETDIEGANRAGCASVLVLTGVHGYVDAVAAEEIQRPQYVIDDLRELSAPYRVEGGSARALLASLWKAIDGGEMSIKQAQHEMASHPEVKGM